MPTSLVAVAIGTALGEAAVGYGLSAVAGFAIGTLASSAFTTAVKGGDFFDNLAGAAVGQAGAALGGAYGGFGGVAGDAAGGVAGEAGQAAATGFGDLGSGFSSLGDAGGFTSLGDSATGFGDLGSGFSGVGDAAGAGVTTGSDLGSIVAQGGGDTSMLGPQTGSTDVMPDYNTSSTPGLDNTQTAADPSGGTDINSTGDFARYDRAGPSADSYQMTPGEQGISDLQVGYGKLSDAYNQANDFLKPVGGVKKVASGLYDMYASNQKANYLKGQMNSLSNMYQPGTPEAELMRKQLEARDAAAGRRSQYGARSTELAAKLAQQRSGILNSGGYQQMQAGYLNNKFGGLNSLFKLG